MIFQHVLGIIYLKLERLGFSFIKIYLIIHHMGWYFGNFCLIIILICLIGPSEFWKKVNE